MMTHEGYNDFVYEFVILILMRYEGDSRCDSFNLKYLKPSN